MQREFLSGNVWPWGRLLCGAGSQDFVGFGRKRCQFVGSTADPMRIDQKDLCERGFPRTVSFYLQSRMQQASKRRPRCWGLRAPYSERMRGQEVGWAEVLARCKRG